MIIIDDIIIELYNVLDYHQSVVSSHKRLINDTFLFKTYILVLNL